MRLKHLLLLLPLLGLVSTWVAHNDISNPGRRSPSTVAPATHPVEGHEARTRAVEDGDCRDLRLVDDSSVRSHVVAVQLCNVSTSGCNAIVVVRIKPTGPPKHSLSANKTLSPALIREWGPDVFRLRVEGPETFLVPLWPLWADGVVNCYHGVLSAHHAGRYRIGLERLYSEYAGVDEKSSVWPPLLKQPLLVPQPGFKTDYHLQQCTLPSVEELRCAVDRTPPAEALPRCTGLEPIRDGRWKRHDTRPFVFTRVRVKKIRKNPILFQWALQPDRYWTWRPLACSRQFPTSSAVKAAFHGKKIAIGGDSQLRALYYAAVNVLRGKELDCVRNITTLAAEPSTCVPNGKGSQRKSIDGVAIDYVDDLFLEKFNGDRYSGYDVVVVGFAQHPASKEHWSVDRYRGAVHAKVGRIRRLLAAGTKVVWYAAPQYPHTTNGYPVVVKDWRTDPRLQLFNSIAEQRMAELRVPVVDAYRVSTAMSHTSPDQAHFSNFVAAELVGMLFEVLCSLEGTSCS